MLYTLYYTNLHSYSIYYAKTTNNLAKQGYEFIRQTPKEFPLLL